MDLSITEFGHIHIANKDVCQKSKQNGKHYRSWWDGSLRAISSGSTLFAYLSIPVYRVEKVKLFICLVIALTQARPLAKEDI